MAEGPKVDVELIRKAAAPGAGSENGLGEIQAGIKSRKEPAMGKGPIKDDNGVLHPAKYERTRTMNHAGGELGPFTITREDH